MGAKFNAPEMTEEDLHEVMQEKNPHICNINFRGRKIPDLHGWFQNCSFVGCDFTGAKISAVFTECSFYDLTADGVVVGGWFQGGTIAQSKFRNCEVRNAVFAFVNAYDLSVANTKIEKCSFQGGCMDRIFLHRGIEASQIEGLETVAITMRGATQEEAANHAAQIYKALLKEGNR